MCSLLGFPNLSLSFRSAWTVQKKRRTVAYTPRLHTKNAEQQLKRVVSSASSRSRCARITNARIQGVRHKQVLQYMRYDSLRAAKRAHIIRSRFALSLSLFLPATKSESRWPISVLQLHVLWPALCLCFGFFRSLSPLSFPPSLSLSLLFMHFKRTRFVYKLHTSFLFIIIADNVKEHHL